MQHKFVCLDSDALGLFRLRALFTLLVAVRPYLVMNDPDNIPVTVFSLANAFRRLALPLEDTVLLNKRTRIW